MSVEYYQGPTSVLNTLNALPPWKNPIRKALRGLWIGTLRLSRVNTAGGGRAGTGPNYTPTRREGGAYFPIPLQAWAH